MKLERYFRYFCFGLAGLILFLSYGDLAEQQTTITDHLSYLGLFLICIEMGVLMTYEQLTAKVTLKNFFSRQSLCLSPVGVFAHTLGQIGFLLLVINFVFGFVQ